MGQDILICGHTEITAIILIDPINPVDLHVPFALGTMRNKLSSLPNMCCNVVITLEHAGLGCPLCLYIFHICIHSHTPTPPPPPTKLAAWLLRAKRILDPFPFRTLHFLCYMFWFLGEGIIREDFWEHCPKKTTGGLEMFGIKGSSKKGKDVTYLGWWQGRPLRV